MIYFFYYVIMFLIVRTKFGFFFDVISCYFSQ